PAEAWLARPLYEDLYCARGDMENRIKEQFGTVRGSGERRQHARQSVAPVSVRHGLFAGVRIASPGTTRNTLGQRASGHDSSTAAENWRPDPSDSASLGCRLIRETWLSRMSASKVSSAQSWHASGLMFRDSWDIAEQF